MPIYRYKCRHCQQEVERLSSINDRDNPETCVCGGSLYRLMTSATFKFKQTGKDLVTDTLNREYKTLPPEQVKIMAPGLSPPPVPVTGRGF